MAYGLEVRQMELNMIKEHGIVKTANFTRVSRTTLWRWKKHGIDRKKRSYTCLLFEKSKDHIK
jgi:DNA invertase Pin-like site-specific DNA recombinase